MAQRGTTAKIDLAELEKLCSLQCTDEELAAWFNVTTRTIERKRKNAKFAEVMNRGKAKGRISIRRMQMKLLEQGNATMGVWLGKNVLNQTDAIKHDITGNITSYLSVILPRAELTADARLGAQPLMDSSKAQDVKIEAADYETVVEDE